jgi:aerobic carbon-monoxide dehydrogenase medium subunit
VPLHGVHQPHRRGGRFRGLPVTETRVLPARDLNTALLLLGSGASGAAPIAGGVHWMLGQAHGLELPRVLVRLDEIPGLARIEIEPDGRLVIGSMARLVDVERSPLVAAHAPALVDAVRTVGSVRIRHQATIGGNVVAGVARHDPPAILLALDARVRSVTPGGVREVAFSPWKADGSRASEPEVVVGLVLPARALGSVSAYHAIQPSAARLEHAAAAIRLDVADDGTIADARIVVADGIRPPWRSERAETALRGRDARAAGIAALAASVEPGPGDAELLAVAVQRAVSAALARRGPR